MTRTVWAVGTALVIVSAVLVCLIPKPEDDLFFGLRIGADILRTGHLPHVDTYSWTRTGAWWVVPEWGALVLYALAFRAGGLFGTWALMTALTTAAALVVWVRLARAVGALWAFPLVSLMLLAMSASVQERPYAFSYPLLAVGLIGLGRSSLTPPTSLTPPKLGLFLPLLCVVWTNLHQGVVVLPLLALVYALGDALTGAWGAARRMLMTAGACALAVMASPYGGQVYANIGATLRDRRMLAQITEWQPAWTVRGALLEPFLLLAGLAVVTLVVSRRQALGDALVVAALLGEALLHVRHIALFAVGSLVVLTPAWAEIAGRLAALRTPRVPGTGGRPMQSWGRGLLLVGLAGTYLATLGLVAAVTVRRAAAGGRVQRLSGRHGLGAAEAEEARFPGAACDFLDRTGAPSHLRLLNDLGDGGYLLWRLPREPVFIDGRLDLYAGRTFDDNLVLARAAGSPAWAALVRRYGLDAVLTSDRREEAAFAADPAWHLVYADPEPGHRPRHFVLLRR